MAKHRLGKDLLVRWRIIDKQGAPYDLAKMDIKVEMFDFFKRKTEILDFVIENTSQIVFTIPGATQKNAGPYSLVAYINKGKEGQSVIDACNCFELVNCIHQESDQGLGGVAVEYEDLVSTITIGIEGKSAYASWLSSGHTGTETDFVNWLREPAVKAGESVNVLADEVLKAETGRADAESLRVQSESARVDAEKIRNDAELLRRTKEDDRIQNEERRNTAESARVREFAELKTGSITATRNANKAAFNANESAENANRAASNAQQEANISKEYNKHQPIIGENGNWWVWSPYAGAYVDTGNPSRGDVCYPEFYVDADMVLHVRKPQAIADGMFRLENGKLILKV